MYDELHIEGEYAFTICSKQYSHIHLENASEITENLIVTVYLPNTSQRLTTVSDLVEEWLLCFYVGSVENEGRRMRFMVLAV
jgi:hypothetical protein